MTCHEIEQPHLFVDLELSSLDASTAGLLRIGEISFKISRMQELSPDSLCLVILIQVRKGRINRQ